MLLEQISGMIEKEKIGEEASYCPFYSSGIDIIDYANGSLEDNNEDYRIGFDGGSIIGIIGKSGSGKSSAGLEIAYSMVKDYEEGQIIHLDYERASKTDSRIKTISGWDDNTLKKKYKKLSRDIYSETIYKLVKGINKIKNDPTNYEKIKIDSGKVDSEGNPIYVLPPTVILIDSWAVVIPKDINEEEELSGSMSASSIAKTNNSIIKRLTGAIEKGNITLIIVNHITKKIDINQFSKTQPDINYLKPDESIPGGSSMLYLCNNILRLTTSSKLDKDSTYGVKGFMVKGEFVKSRSSEAGVPFEMVFEQSTGFDNVLTNLANFKSLNLLKGSPRAYYLEDCPDIKFTLKTFKDKYYENEELRNVVDRMVKENYSELIKTRNKTRLNNLETSEEEYEDDEEIELVKCVDEENDIWIGSDNNYYDSDGNEADYTPVKNKKKKK